MFSVRCVFVDHASFILSPNNKYFKATETIKGKNTLNREVQSQGVVIKGYHTDDCVLNTSELMVEFSKNQ